MSVRDTMMPDPVGVLPHARVDAAIEIMKPHKAGGRPVESEAGPLAGRFSEYDLAKLAASRLIAATSSAGTTARA